MLVEMVRLKPHIEKDGHLLDLLLSVFLVSQHALVGEGRHPGEVEAGVCMQHLPDYVWKFEHKCHEHQYQRNPLVVS